MHPLLTRNVDWARKPMFAAGGLVCAVVLYILSLGPVLCLCQAGATGGWNGWPKGVRYVYAPLRAWITPDYDTWYGRYTLWWINLQYWRHW